MNHETAAARTTKGNKSVGDCQLAITAAASSSSLPARKQQQRRGETAPRSCPSPLSFVAFFSRARGSVVIFSRPSSSSFLSREDVRPPIKPTARGEAGAGSPSRRACAYVQLGRREGGGRDKVYDRERSSTSHHPRQMPARWSDANRGGGARGERFPSFGFIRTRTTVQHETISRIISTNKGFPTQKNKQQWAQDPH